MDDAARAFRKCVGEFATGVTVVTTEHDGVPAGMTLNSFTSISVHPLLILVSLAHGARTLEAVRASGRFAVSILHRRQRAVAVAFAERGAPFPAHHTARDHTVRDRHGTAAGWAGSSPTPSCPHIIPSDWRKESAGRRKRRSVRRHGAYASWLVTSRRGHSMVRANKEEG